MLSERLPIRIRGFKVILQNGRPAWHSRHSRRAVEVLAPDAVFDVSLRALERWAGSPSTSPKAHLAKRIVRKP
jgi:hypothetical protein